MNQKITLSFNESQLLSFKKLINTSDLDELKAIVNMLAEKDDPKKYVQRKVFEAVSDLSGYDLEKIKESQNLRDDLRFTLYLKRALNPYFLRILRDLGSAKNVTVKECENLKKVSDGISLLNSKL